MQLERLYAPVAGWRGQRPLLAVLCPLRRAYSSGRVCHAAANDVARPMGLRDYLRYRRRGAERAAPARSPAGFRSPPQWEWVPIWGVPQKRLMAVQIRQLSYRRNPRTAAGALSTAWSGRKAQIVSAAPRPPFRVRRRHRPSTEDRPRQAAPFLGRPSPRLVDRRNCRLS